DLLRVGLTRACAKAKDRINDPKGHDDENQSKNNVRYFGQIEDRPCLGRLRIQCIRAVHRRKLLFVCVRLAANRGDSPNCARRAKSRQAKNIAAIHFRLVYLRRACRIKETQRDWLAVHVFFFALFRYREYNRFGSTSLESNQTSPMPFEKFEDVGAIDNER